MFVCKDYKLTWSSLVNLESRNGTCGECGSASAAMTLPKADREVLIDFASDKRVPLETVLLTRSLPAKSTIRSFDRILDLRSTESSPTICN